MLLVMSLETATGLCRLSSCTYDLGGEHNENRAGEQPRLSPPQVSGRASSSGLGQEPICAPFQSRCGFQTSRKVEPRHLGPIMWLREIETECSRDGADGKPETTPIRAPSYIF